MMSRRVDHAEVSMMRMDGEKKVRGAGGDYGRIGDELAKVAESMAVKDAGKRKGFVYSCQVIVRGCGHSQMTVVLGKGVVQFIEHRQHHATDESEHNHGITPNRRVTLSFPEPIHPPTPILKEKIHLATIKEILYTETDATTIAMDFEKHDNEMTLWGYSVLSFVDAHAKDLFLGYLLKTRRAAAPGLANLIVTVVSDPLLSVEYAKRAISMVKLRRALELQMELVDKEDDYAGLGVNPAITSLLRNKGDTTLRLSLYVQLLGDRADTKSLLLITGSSLCLLQDNGREYKLDAYIRIERLKSAVFATSQSLLILTLRGEKKQDGGLLRHLQHESLKEHSKKDIHIRVLANPGVALEEAVYKIQVHLEKVFLDVRIERLPFRFEHQVFFPSKLDLAKQAGSKLARFLSKQRKDDEVADATRQDLYPAYKWVLVVVKERVFDLIDTFTNLNISPDSSRFHIHGNSKNRDHLIGRRLGLSLVALCAHLDLTHQLMYECILYEIMSCFGPDRNPTTIFQHDTFGITLISLYLGSKIDQFARLSLSQAVEDFQQNFSPTGKPRPPSRREQDLEQYSWRYLKAITNPDLLHAFPYELLVIVAMIKRCVEDISEEGLTVAGMAVDVYSCIGAFLMQRVWLPAIQNPYESGITTGAVNKPQAKFLTQVGSVLNNSFGYGSPPEFMGGWREKSRGEIVRYLDSIIDEQMMGRARMFEAIEEDNSENNNNNKGLGRKFSAGGEIAISKMNSIDLVRRHNVLTQSATATKTVGKPKAFNKLLDKVVTIHDDELKLHLSNLSSVHEALGRDTGRLLTSLMANVSKLKQRAKDVEVSIQTLEEELTQADSNSPFSECSSVSFREASPLNRGVKRWKRALMGIQLGGGGRDDTPMSPAVDTARDVVYTAFVTIPVYGVLCVVGGVCAVVGKNEAEKFSISPSMLAALDVQAEGLEAELKTRLKVHDDLLKEISMLEETLSTTNYVNPSPPPPSSPYTLPSPSPALSATTVLAPHYSTKPLSSTFTRLGTYTIDSPSSSYSSSSSITSAELQDLLGNVTTDVSVMYPSAERRWREEEEEEEEEELSTGCGGKYHIREVGACESDDRSMESLSLACCGEEEGLFLPDEN